MGEGSTETLTVVVQVEPAPPDPERMEDLTIAFGLVLAAVIIIWFSRQLLNLFSVNPSNND